MAGLAHLVEMAQIGLSDQIAKPRIAIIGGGYAGMAAAVALMDAGITDLTLYEAGPILGGRARRIPGGNGDEDNGQHLCLGAYTELLKLMVRVGADPEDLFYRCPLSLIIHTLNNPLGKKSKSLFSLRANRYLPAPLNLATSILLSSGSSFSERVHTLQALYQLKQQSYLISPGLTVSQLCDEHGIHGVFRHFFWESLCLAALNTPPQFACAQTFLNILQDIAEGHQQASNFLIPRTDLSSLFPEPAAQYIQKKGAEVYTSCAIKQCEPAGKLIRVVGTRHHRLYHHVILATPPRAASTLITGWGEPMHDLGNQLRLLPHEKIATLSLEYSHRRFRLPFPMMGIAHSPIEWIVDRSYLLQQPSTKVLKDSSASHTPSSRFTCVISAPHESSNLDKGFLTSEAHACLQSLCGSLPQPNASRLVVEKFATLSCRPDIHRPQACTPDPRLILAGDYLQSRYPSTLETAVRSGLSAAALTIKHMQA